jgi:hypothetical protein
VSAVFPQPIITVFKNIHADQPLDATETDNEAVSLIRYHQALFKRGSFSMRSKLSALLVPICSSHGRPFWSLKINLLDTNKQPTQTNFQLAAKQQIQTSNRRLKLNSRPNDEMQQEVDSIFSPFRFLFLIVKTARKSLKTIWRFTDWNEQPTSTLLLIRTLRTNVLPAISSNKIPFRFRLLEKTRVPVLHVCSDAHEFGIGAPVLSTCKPTPRIIKSVSIFFLLRKSSPSPSSPSSPSRV